MAADPLIGREIAGYRIEALIGRGGMGVVYRAEHTLLGRRDALKVLAGELAEDAGFRERFLRESRLAAAIEHPNIIPIYHAGEADGLLYIAMRYIEGTDLRELLKREGPLDPDRTIAMLGQVGGALDTAHASGLVHRDVKPANILIAAGDRVYLSDFGIAKQTATRGLTKTGSFVGTLDYAAPEQIEGKELDGRADVYSLACVLCECLTGAVPYLKDSEVQVLYAHLLEPPPMLTARRPELGHEVDSVIATALAKSRDERYGSCQDLLAALSDALTAQPATPVPPLVAPPTRAAPQRQAPPSSTPAPPSPTPVSLESWTPQPESESPSAAPSFPSRAAPTAERRGTGIWLLAAMAALLAVAAFATVLLTRGGSHDTRSAAVDRLLARVPASLRNSCHSRSIPIVATAGVLCTSGSETASYFAFAKQGSMNRYYDAQWRRAGIGRNSGNCGDLPFRGERPYSLDGKPGGRVFCATSGGGTAALVGWTDPRTRIYALASRSDGNQTALLGWWSGAGGPLAPSAAKVARRSARVAPGTVVYRDTFSAKSSGWQTAGKILGYANRRYRIVVPKANFTIVSTAGRLLFPEPLFRNVVLQVTARRVSGLYSVGLVCRFASVGANRTYYALQARRDGLLQIKKIVRMKVHVLRSRPSGRPLRQARLRAVCSGGGAKRVRLSLSVNGGRPLTFRERSPLTAGAVGLVAQSGGVPGVAIEFDDFVVRTSPAPR